MKTTQKLRIRMQPTALYNMPTFAYVVIGKSHSECYHDCDCEVLYVSTESSCKAFQAGVISQGGECQVLELYQLQQHIVIGGGYKCLETGKGLWLMHNPHKTVRGTKFIAQAVDLQLNRYEIAWDIDKVTESCDWSLYTTRYLLSNDWR